MRLVPDSFEGLYINDYHHLTSTFKEFFARGQSQSSLSSVDRFQAYPAPGSKQLSEKQLVVAINVKDNYGYWRDILAHYLSTGLLTMSNLYARDLDTGRLWYVSATPISFVASDRLGKGYSVTFEVPDPIWRSSDEVSQSAAVTVSGSILTCRVRGNVDTEPVITLALTTQKTGVYLYRQFTSFVNNSTQPLTDYPIDITNGGWNTAALVAAAPAGKMRSDGADLRVTINGLEVDRWLDGINTATTKVWVNVTCPPKQTFKLKVAIEAGGSISTLTVTPTQSATPGPKYVLTGLPQSGILRCGTEEFTYTSYVLKTGVFSGVLRSQRATSAAAHAIGAVVYYLPLDVQVLYGDSDAEDPVVDDTKKPVLNLNTSTNISWVYSVFGSLNPRSAKFSDVASTTVKPDTNLYTATHETDADPYSVMGMSIFSYESNGKWQSVTENQCWQLLQPCGITHVSSTGEGYRVSASWPDATLEYSTNGKNWAPKWTSTKPASTLTWTAWTTAAQALGATRLFIRFRQAGSVSGVINNKASFEVQTCTLTLDSTLTPTLGLRGEDITSYYCDIEFLNVQTGESLYCHFPLATGDTIILDTEAHQAYRLLDGLSVLSGVSQSSNRLSWLRMITDPKVGYKDNQIKIIETGMGHVTFTIKWRDRNN